MGKAKRPSSVEHQSEKTSHSPECDEQSTEASNELPEYRKRLSSRLKERLKRYDACKNGLSDSVSDDDRLRFNRTFFSDVLEFTENDSDSAEVDLEEFVRIELERTSLGHEVRGLQQAVTLRNQIDTLETFIKERFEAGNVDANVIKNLQTCEAHLNRLKSSIRLGYPIDACVHALQLCMALPFIITDPLMKKTHFLWEKLKQRSGGLEKARSQSMLDATERAKLARSEIEKIWAENPSLSITSARKILAKRQSHGSYESIKRYTKGMKFPPSGGTLTK